MSRAKPKSPIFTTMEVGLTLDTKQLRAARSLNTKSQIIITDDDNSNNNISNLQRVFPAVADFAQK